MPLLLVLGRGLGTGTGCFFSAFDGPAFSSPDGDEGDASFPFSISLSRASEGDWPIFRVQEVIFGLPFSGVADVLERVLGLGEVGTSPEVVWLLGGGCGLSVVILLLLLTSGGRGVSLSLFSFGFGGVLRASSATAASFPRMPAFSFLRFSLSELLVEGLSFLDFGLPVEDPTFPASGLPIEDSFFVFRLSIGGCFSMTFGPLVEAPLSNLGLLVEAPVSVFGLPVEACGCTFGLPVEASFSVFGPPVEACPPMIFGLPVEALVVALGLPVEAYSLLIFGLPVEAFVFVFRLPVEACFSLIFGLPVEA